MEKIIVATGHNDHDAGISLSEGKVNNELAAGWKLKYIRIEKNRNLMIVIYILEK